MTGDLGRPPRPPMVTVRTIDETRSAVTQWRRAGQTVGVVPTMGALHEGHLALMRQARQENDRVVSTLFVNPLQFGPGEDYDSYPRDEERDSALLEAEGCDLLFAPEVAEMFPDSYRSPADFLTSVSVDRLSEHLCGRSRPGHFTGMVTEVVKLLLITAGDVAYFGEKDFQQLQIVRRVARDLNIPTRIAAVTTVREPDGLALSSRNQYLTPEQRAVAPLLHRVLVDVAARASAGAPCGSLADEAAQRLLDGGFASIDYVTVVTEDDLQPVEVVTGPARVAAAARLGRARLIDNVAVPVAATPAPRGTSDPAAGAVPVGDRSAAPRMGGGGS